MVHFNESCQEFLNAFYPVENQIGFECLKLRVITTPGEIRKFEVQNHHPVSPKTKLLGSYSGKNQVK